jgi:hypothetical protein
MRLYELFDDGNVTDDLKNSLMDILTPLVASKVPFVTVQQVIDKLRTERTGLSIDRSLIMDLLDPDQVKIVKKIEGDRIYLAPPEEEERSVTKDEMEKDKEHVADMGADQAKKNISSGGDAGPM